MAMAPGTKRLVADINVTPLVDVVLVLLIVFMVLTPLAEKQMAMRIPELEPAVESVPTGQIVLTLEANGRVRINEEEMSFDEAIHRLETAYRGRESKVLFFDAEDTVKYDDAVHLLDEARRAGVSVIGMMTDTPGPD
jgi:biopolymer transport protein TolR